MHKAALARRARSLGSGLQRGQVSNKGLLCPPPTSIFLGDMERHGLGRLANVRRRCAAQARVQPVHLALLTLPRRSISTRHDFLPPLCRVCRPRQLDKCIQRRSSQRTRPVTWQAAAPVHTPLHTFILEHGGCPGWHAY